DDYIIAACRNDQDDILIDLLKLKNHDINFTDGAGNTAAHHAYNIATGDTPLHQAVQYTDEPDIALAMVDVLLQASADPRLKNKNDQTPIMLVDPKDEDMLDLLKQAIAGYEMVI
ncbi:hypothetical protein F4703DRAFT_1727025, partial [Phycomyces blakesleeanus]